MMMYELFLLLMISGDNDLAQFYLVVSQFVYPAQYLNGNVLDLFLCPGSRFRLSIGYFC